jgi:hypothetical protein
MTYHVLCTSLDGRWVTGDEVTDRDLVGLDVERLLVVGAIKEKLISQRQPASRLKAKVVEETEETKEVEAPIAKLAGI